MPNLIRLEPGEHEIAGVVALGSIRPKDSHPPTVMLRASIESDPAKMFPRSLAATATNLEMQVDCRVAVQLYEQIGDLIRDMGWQQYVSGGRPI